MKASETPVEHAKDSVAQFAAELVAVASHTVDRSAFEHHMVDLETAIRNYKQIARTGRQFTPATPGIEFLQRPPCPYQSITCKEK